MHRQRTKLVERTTRVVEKLGRRRAGLVARAKQAQFRGIITTYKLHDRLLGNRAARRRFEQRPARARRRAAARARRPGATTTTPSLPFADLVRRRTRSRAVEKEGAEFVARSRAAADAPRRRAQGLPRPPLRSAASELSLDSPWLAACLSIRCSAWRTRTSRCGRSSSMSTSGTRCRSPPTSDRIHSQRWHRDFDDSHLLKVFLYLVDVDEQTGPFEFVAGSARGRYGGRASIPGTR